MKHLIFAFFCCIVSGLLHAQKQFIKPNEVVVKFERSFVERELQPAFSDVRERKAMPAFRTQSIRDLNEKHSVVNFTPMVRTDPRHAERHREFGLDLFYRVEFSADQTVEEVIRSFMESDVVLHAEPRIVHEIHQSPNDAQYNNQWGLRNTAHPFPAGMRPDINVEPAWQITRGHPSVVVAVIDNVVEATHEDLRPNLWINTGEIPANGIDDDGNGFIDDIHGWNYVNNGGAMPLRNQNESHGTHVAGIIAARTNNGLGVAGVAGGWGDEPGASMMIFRAGEGNSVSFGYEAMVYAADNGAAIVNASWGGFSVVMTDAQETFLRYFQRNGGGDVMNGGLVVAAAGNDNSTVRRFPASASGVLAVGSITSQGERSSFSNHGSDWVRINAPGSAIRSALPGDQYGDLQGTSMAAPMVAGVAALVLSATRDFPKELKTPEWLANVLIASGNRMWPPSSTMGPLVNAHAAIELAIQQLETTVSIQQAKPTQAVISIFPNPVNDAVTVVTQPESRISSYSLISIGGKTIFQKQNPSTEETIDMASFPAGVYILLVQTDSGIFTERIIKL